MRYFFGNNPQDIYPQQLGDLIRNGAHTDVRGRHTIEMLDAITEVRTPFNPCILIPSRRWNPWLALSEGLWILAGRNDVASLKPYNSHIVEYSDNGETLYGAYGKRIFNQIDLVVERLENDPQDRRAVLQIWDALSDEHESRSGMGDLTVNSKDPPCNNLVYFKLRLGQLYMTVVNRSNDLHYGLYAVNIPTFQMLHQYIAARLGVGVGVQTHLSNSLHIYTDDSRANTITENMLRNELVQTYPAHRLMFEDLPMLDEHKDFARICGEVLDGQSDVEMYDIPFLTFAGVFLEMYRARDWHPEYLDLNYADWIQAGQSYIEQVWK